ncbi:MAG: Hsp20 family protein, partial [Bdellovibrionales bacterium]|nr:Hsp20 family protein [Bdellovibrionales bacterium]
KEALHQEREHAEKVLDTEKQRSLQIQSQEKQQTQKFQDRQQELRTNIQKQYQESISEFQDKSNKEKRKIAEGYYNEKEILANEHQKQVKQMRLKSENDYSRLKSDGNLRLKSLKDQQDIAYQSEVKSQHINLAHLKEQARRAREKEKLEGLHQFKKQKTENQLTVKNEKLRGEKATLQTQGEYKERLQDIHKKGDKELAFEKDRQQNVENRLKTTHEKELKVINREHEDKKLQTLEDQNRQMQQIDHINNRALENQRKEFQNKYVTNKERNEQILQTQETLFTKALTKQKTDQLKQSNHFTEKKDDPFYSLHGVPTQLIDNNSHYILKTEIPNHEKGNINVIVKQDKIIVSGQRAFEDRVEQDGRTASTNNYQSFREEILLDQPVQSDQIQKDYHEGILTTIIPKLLRNKPLG